ncbi:esterase/lipase family protein [Baaleninema simplex]|uniref:esterase/lipase family protein n=1 Tax=Baaleninema simplex TaxID=2862350 RepID=UPI00034BCFFC|nr:alpha/beta fold hydrolase [Baaleninema simplex]
MKRVVLVHGIFRQSRVFRKLASRLKNLGYHVTAPDLYHQFGALSLTEVAEQLQTHIETHFDDGEPFDLVGLSMGGIVSRYYLQRLGGLDRLRRFVTIASPHFGTWTAYGFPRTTALDMRPGSPLLEDLNRDVELLDRATTVSIWTPWDFIIVPARSCCLPVGKTVRVNVFPHGMMAWHDRSVEAIVGVLSEGEVEPAKFTES